MKKTPLYTMTACALMAALMCVLCPISLPIGPIPISLSILVIVITTMVLGTWRALVSYTVYLLLGAVGMPVFSGFQGGLAKLAGPTGGYLVGFYLIIVIGGIVMELTKGCGLCIGYRLVHAADRKHPGSRVGGLRLSLYPC